VIKILINIPENERFYNLIVFRRINSMKKKTIILIVCFFMASAFNIAAVAVPFFEDVDSVCDCEGYNGYRPDEQWKDDGCCIANVPSSLYENCTVGQRKDCSDPDTK
jgi:hypothetical protein